MHPKFFEPTTARCADGKYMAAVEAVYPNGERFVDYLMDVSNEHAQVFEFEPAAARAAFEYSRRLYRQLGEQRQLDAEEPDMFE